MSFSLLVGPMPRTNENVCMGQKFHIDPLACLSREGWVPLFPGRELYARQAPQKESAASWRGRSIGEIVISSSASSPFEPVTTEL
jgi:hypothetical protein